MHLEKQIQVRALLFNKVATKIPVKYSDFNNVFLVKNATELLKNSKINEHIITLIKRLATTFRSIYSLKLVELEILKTYI